MRKTKSELLPSVHPKCGKFARTTKYGSEYTLICVRSKDHNGKCRDVNNVTQFEPDN